MQEIYIMCNGRPIASKMARVLDIGKWAFLQNQRYVPEETKCIEQDKIFIEPVLSFARNNVMIKTLRANHNIIIHIEWIDL